MKKLLLWLTLTSSALLLGACDSGYNLNERSIITEVEIIEVDSHMVGKSTEYTLIFERNGKEQELDLDDGSALRSELESINKTSAILDSDEKLLFDLSLDGDDIVSVSLSKNRK